MAKKLYDLKVKVGEYQKDGDTKGRYETIGAVMANDDGGKFIMLRRTFNPAGVPNPDGRDALLVSMFEPYDDSGDRPQRQTGGTRREPQQRAPASKSVSDAPMDDDIPF